jgi:hypothetical protein
VDFFPETWYIGLVKENTMKNEDSPMEVKVDQGVLMISIGIDTLAWAFEHQDDNNPWLDSAHDFVQSLKVIDPLQFAKDVACEITREEEDGTSPLHLFFDKMCNEACDQGSGGVDDSTDGLSAYARDYKKENTQ